MALLALMRRARMRVSAEACEGAAGTYDLAAGDASSASSVARFSCRMAAAARGPPAASPHASDTHYRRLLLTALICCCVSHRLVFTDEEGIDVIGNLLFAFLAAVLKQFSGPRCVHAEARGDARTACPRERLEAHMGCRAAATVQLLHARPDSRELGRTWESRLAEDRASQTGAVAAPQTLM